jgi:hypothetical protein
MSRTKDFRDMPLFVPDSETSRAAAESMIEAAGTLRSKVRIYIVTEGYDGATDDEVEVALGLKSNTARPRRHELMERSLVMDSGRTRKTRSGRDATVWITAPEGHEYKDRRSLHKLERKVIEAAKAWALGECTYQEGEILNANLQVAVEALQAAESAYTKENDHE